MKRISMLVALAIVLALAVPAFAGPFSDVPTTHWAYEAVNKLAGTGLLTGYPDGSFSGKNAMTRYEIATVVARLLDKLAAERALVTDKVETLEDGLTAGQAEDVIAIFKSLIAKEAAKFEVEIPENLTETQAEEVAAIVEALAMEFQFELEAMGAKVDALTTDVEDLKVRVADLEVIDWRGTYDVEVNKTVIDTVAVAYVDPFAMVDEDDEVVAYDEADSAIYHELGLGFDVTTDNLEASFDLAVTNDNFVAAVDNNFLLDELTATVTGDEFTAVLAREQLLNLAPYLFGDDEAEYNGIEVTVGDDVYALIRTGAADIFAAKKALNIMDATMYFGMDNIVDLNDFVVGVEAPYTVFDTELNVEVALEKSYDAVADANDYGKFFAVNATKAFGSLNVEGNYTLNDDEFVGIEASGIAAAGYDIAADMALLDDMITVNGRYNAYSVTDYGFGADLVKGNLTADFDMEWASDDANNEADRMQINAEYTTDVAFTNVVAGFAYDQYDDALALYVDDDDVALEELNRIYADFAADLPVEGLTGTANYVFGLVDDVDDKGLSVHEYAVAYENDMYTAGASLDLVAEVLTVNAGIEYSIFSASIEKDFMESDTLDVVLGVDPEAYEVLGFSVDTIAGFEMLDSDYNYNFNVDVAKDLSDRADVAYGFVYDNREIAADDSLNGLVVKHTVAFGYELATDLNAEVNYTYLDFDSIVDAEDYVAKELTTGLSLSF